MLIPFKYINDVLTLHHIKINGSFHIGASECEEMPFYNSLGLTPENIIWIDAIPSAVVNAKNRGIPNVYQNVITDKDDEDIVFNVSNNGQSSSIFDFGTHSQEHPQIHYVDKLNLKTITIDTFFERNNIDASKYEFWNFDIQGAELLALRGGIKSIQYAKAIYLEVNVNELYKNCARINEIDAFLYQYNFERILINMTHHGWGDALYINMG